MNIIKIKEKEITFLKQILNFPSDILLCSIGILKKKHYLDFCPYCTAKGP
jgi:hypothetical protein